MSTYLKSCAGPELFTPPFAFVVTKQLQLNIKQPGVESKEPVLCIHAFELCNPLQFIQISDN